MASKIAPGIVSGLKIEVKCTKEKRQVGGHEYIQQQGVNWSGFS